MSTIINDFLYLGSLSDACTPEILNKLQITHLINLSLTKIILDQSFEILHLPLNDSLDENIKKYFQQTNQFIEKCHQQSNGRCLVFCKHGRSRSAASQSLISHFFNEKCFFS
jgi:rhodanese-related sulfurtransferase